MNDPTPVAEQVRAAFPKMPTSALAELERLGPLPSPTGEGETEEDRDARLAAQRVARSRRAQERIPGDALFADAAQIDAEAQSLVTGWWASKVRVLWLLGPVGVGKTCAAGIAANPQWIVNDEGLSFCWWYVPDLMAALRPDGDPHAWADIELADVLVLDDVGVEKPSEWTAEQWDRIADVRSRDGRIRARRTVLTSNLDASGLREWLGPRAFSRLAGDSTPVRLTGPDRRLTPR